jgi:hypothetical protein
MSSEITSIESSMVTAGLLDSLGVDCIGELRRGLGTPCSLSIRIASWLSVWEESELMRDPERGK